MLFTEEAARDNIRNRDGRRVFLLGKNDRLTAAARDYLNRERIEILSAEQARPERYALLGGGYAEDKPEHMTHLDGQTLVSKRHPRIHFRGKLDTLESELILAQQAAPVFHRELGEILGFARTILCCEVLNEAAPDTRLLGLSDEELRRHSHFPQKYYSQPHFMPEAADGPEIARLNRARCAAREAELAAVDAFSSRDGEITRPDLIRAMNRLSSALYLLMIRAKSSNSLTKEGHT